MDDEKSDLELRSEGCDLCRMLWTTSERLDKGQAKSVRFDRVESTIRMNGSNIPVFSIHASPGKHTFGTDLIQAERC